MDETIHGWFRWNGGTGARIAQAIRETGDHSGCPVLADALEEGGCDNALLLALLRGGGGAVEPSSSDRLVYGRIVALGYLPRSFFVWRRIDPERADAAANFRLRIIRGRPEGRRLCFPPGEYVFGRGAECHIRPNSDWVSGRHCLLRVTAASATVRDLGSRIGTLVNGTRVLDERRLGPGDQLQVGPLVFEVQFEERRAERTRGPEVVGPLDPLTLLLNRQAILDAARWELCRQARDRSPLSLGIVEVDHFREVNRRYLVPGGDAALVGLARTLAGALCRGDSLGRRGGDDFLVVAPETNYAGAVRLAERIRRAVEQSRTTYKDQQISLTVSLGFAVVERGSPDYDRVNEVASAALREAKSGGRNRSAARVVS